MVSSISLTTFPTARADDGEDRWRQMGQRWFGNGVWPGVRNEFQPYGDSSGMRVKVRAGEAWVLGEYCEMTSESILDIGTAHPTLARIDLVVLRLDTTSPATANLQVIAGTPASTPVPSSATANDVVLAQVLVAAQASTISPNAVSDLRRFASTYSKAPTSTALVNNWQNRGGLYSPASFWRDGSGVVHFDGRIYGGTTGLITFTLPVGYRPQYQQIFMCHAESGSSRGVFAVVVAPVGDVSVFGTTTSPGGIADIDLCSVSFKAIR